jgi:uncharacterized membrane protein YbhN (UPF0104 family)
VPPVSISKVRLGISLFILLGVIVFTIHHLAEARHFARLLERSQPGWVLLAIGLQSATYVCAGGIWQAVAVSAAHRLRIGDLARLSVEKLSIDQFIPAGGMAGNVVVIKALRRLGLPAALATEAMLIDILAFYIAYASVGAVALWVLWLRHEVTRVVVALVLAFCVILAAVPLGIVWLLRHRNWQPPGWLGRLQPLTRLRQTVGAVSVQRVRSPRLLATAAVLHTSIFLLDGATLWAMLKALGTPLDLSSCFVALVIASMAGTVSFLPGGIGGFEIGMTATLVLLGASLDVALTGTLFTRGLDLWITLVPGLIFARRELWRGGRQPAHR